MSAVPFEMCHLSRWIVLCDLMFLFILCFDYMHDKSVVNVLQKKFATACILIFGAR